MTSGERFPALDGVRGCAIMAVFAFHLSVFSGYTAQSGIGQFVQRIAGGGWIGVDLFFVLSGFLITAILLRTKDGGNYLVGFYSRRALRIAPLYYGTLLSIWVFHSLFSHESYGKGAWVGLLTYTSNVLLAVRGWQALPSSIQHFWSLAVEEQFYLVWPFVVLLLTSRRLNQCCWCFVAMAVFARLVITEEQILNPMAAPYVLTLCRMDALAIGSLIAIRNHRSESLDSFRWLGMFGTVGIAAFVLHYGRLDWDNSMMKRIGYTLLDLIFAWIVVGCLKDGWFRRLMSARLLRTIGQYSYGIYVFHQPVLDWISGQSHPHDVPSLLLFLWVAVGTTVLAALLSWRFLEKPCLDLRRHWLATAYYATKPKVALR